LSSTWYNFKVINGGTLYIIKIWYIPSNVTGYVGMANIRFEWLVLVFRIWAVPASYHDPEAGHHG